MSEVSDALVICVSEETGNVSFSVGGTLKHAVSRAELRQQLLQLQDKIEENNKKFIIKKGRRSNERQIEE
jgi:diadenylate cyclase